MHNTALINLIHESHGSIESFIKLGSVYNKKTVFISAVTLSMCQQI